MKELITAISLAAATLGAHASEPWVVGVNYESNIVIFGKLCQSESGAGLLATYQMDGTPFDKLTGIGCFIFTGKNKDQTANGKIEWKKERFKGDEKIQSVTAIEDVDGFKSGVLACDQKNLVSSNKSGAAGCTHKNRAGETIVLWSTDEEGGVFVPSSPSKPQPAITARPRFDQYGRQLPSVREICNSVRANGGPVTEACARDAYMQSIGR